MLAVSQEKELNTLHLEYVLLIFLLYKFPKNTCNALKLRVYFQNAISIRKSIFLTCSLNPMCTQKVPQSKIFAQCLIKLFSARLLPQMKF